MVFKTEAELYECMRYWKRVLMLHDWTVQCRLVPELYCDGEECWGLSTSDTVGRNALIQIRQINPSDADKITKYCAEYTLIHELLHLVYPIFEKETYEAHYYGVMEHRKLDKLAQSLLMAKYDLTFDWFENKKD